jgi:hypothetical protein
MSDPADISDGRQNKKHGKIGRFRPLRTRRIGADAKKNVHARALLTVRHM